MKENNAHNASSCHCIFLILEGATIFLITCHTEMLVSSKSTVFHLLDVSFLRKFLLEVLTVETRIIFQHHSSLDIGIDLHKDKKQSKELHTNI